LTFNGRILIFPITFLIGEILMRCKFGLIASLLLSSPVVSLAQTAPPNAINFQARLTTSSGNPVPDGTYTVRIRFYDAETGGNVKHEQTLNNAQVKNGIIAILIGQFTASVFDGNTWMGIKLGSDAELTPRTQIVSVPYAIKSNLAVTVPDGSITNAKINAVDWSKLTNKPATLLSLPYSGSTTTFHPNYVAFSIYNSAGGADAINGTGNYTGIRGSASSASGSAGVRGEGFVGVLGNSSSTTGYGVQGTADNGGGRGVYGNAYQGVYGRVGGASGYGVYGDKGNSVGYAIYANGPAGGVGAWRNDSDVRYKMHITTVENSLDKILGLRGVTFDWNQSAFPAKHFDSGRQIGFIAQEVEKILPEIVATDWNGYKSVAYANVVPVLVEAVKTLKQDNDRKDARLHKIEAENAELRTKLDALADAVRQLQADRK
jgi:hypothetical protein